MLTPPYPWLQVLKAAPRGKGSPVSKDHSSRQSTSHSADAQNSSVDSVENACSADDPSMQRPQPRMEQEEQTISRLSETQRLSEEGSMGEEDGENPMRKIHPLEKFESEQIDCQLHEVSAMCCSLVVCPAACIGIMRKDYQGKLWSCR